jgi:hypothetical protein
VRGLYDCINELPCFVTRVTYSANLKTIKVHAYGMTHLYYPTDTVMERHCLETDGNSSGYSIPQQNPEFDCVHNSNLTRICEEFCSNLVRGTDQSDRGIPWLFSVTQGKWRFSTSIRPQSLPSKSLRIYHPSSFHPTLLTIVRKEIYACCVSRQSHPNAIQVRNTY